MFNMVKLIVARASNGVIGKNNDLIWHLPADMRFFTQTTKGHVVIMGRRNWDSIPLKYRPLSDRINVVVTRNETFTNPDCIVFHNLKNAVEAYKNKGNQDVYIIGGGQIYASALEAGIVEEMLITEIDFAFEGDTWFPAFNEAEWEKECILQHPKDEKNPYSFSVWKYTRKPTEKSKP